MYEDFLRAQIVLCHYVQENLQVGEPLWVLLSEHFSTAKIMDIFMPIVGAFHQQLLIRLVCSMGVMNVLISLVKWCSPEYRPYWWIREMENQKNWSQVSLRQHPLTCETTAGFPSSHAMTFTTFIYLSSIFAFPACFPYVRLTKEYLNKICFVFVAIGSFAMWLSRFYMASQFLHQSLMSSVLAITLLHFFDKHAFYLYTLSRFKAVGGVFVLAYLPVVVYFVMLYADVDPHWSVRMAFKWCKDPAYLRHEASPIFVLSRDFGFLMGIAISARLSKRYDCNKYLIKRIFVMIILESFNYYVRLKIPKGQGRLVFVSYECIRNLLHSYCLLTIMSCLS